MVVVLDVQLATQFRELRRVAALLKGSGRYQPIFSFTDPPAEALERMRATLELEGIPHVLFEPREAPAADGAPAGPPSAPPRRTWKRALAELPEIGPLVESVPEALKTIRRRFFRAPHFLDEVRPALLLSGEDGMGANRPLLSAARQRGIPVAVVPFQISTRREPGEAIVNLPAYRRRFGMDSLVNRIVASRLPKWVHRHEGQDLLREPALNILVEELVGTAPANPWTVHGGSALKLAVESPRMHRHYLAEGVPPSKLALTGALYDDELSRNLERKAELRASVCRALGFDPGRRTILCSLPPPALNRPRCDFPSHGALVDFWLSALAMEGVNVIVQLHPTISRAQEREIAAKGARITHEDVTTLIPACDLLITSISSIIRLAIACGVPVLNYDVYRYGYDDYEGAPGVITVTEQSDFLRWTHDLALDPTILRAVAQKQAEVARDWGVLDGRAGERMLELFDGLVRTRT
jgi:hypothetical protein